MNTELQEILNKKHRQSLPNILLVSAECAPLSKTGGLADVVGALPQSLKKLGFDARVITPYHRCIKENYADRVSHICDFEINLGWRRQYVGLEMLSLNGLVIYLVDNEFYFGGKIYCGGRFEGEQYAFFQRAVLECIPRLGFLPEVLHLNDWHTAMIPFLIKTQYGGGALGGLKTVLSIHNIAYQGKFSFDFAADLLGIDRRYYNPGGVEHYGCVNFLKAGCVFADRLTTVSPGYAREILTPEYGEGLEGVLSARSGELTGIINGLYTEAFDPATDEAIYKNFSLTSIELKAENKKALLRDTGLEQNPDRPLIAMVSRMTAQKGFDLVIGKIDEMISLGASFLLLGSGDAAFENAMRYAQNRHPGRVCAHIGYDEALSRKIYAGADFLLMPSAFEPCGLSQLIAMRYGTLPIVRETGGLRDTVVPYNRFTGEGNGFSFSGYGGADMMSAVRLALDTYTDKDAMKNLIRSAMSRDSSFDGPALSYAAIFAELCSSAPVSDLEGKAGHVPQLEAYREPFGPVKCGESVSLRVRADLDAVFSAALVIGGETIPMQKDGSFYRARWTAPAKAEVLWYHFDLNGGILLGSSGLGFEDVGGFQMTVYDADFDTPSWAKGAVMYQIFPDRYCRKGAAPEKGAAYHRKMGREIELHKAWTEPVKWQGDGGEDYYPNDFYGGTLSGIESKLPDLKALGVECIYLNPVFEADSNHRYNTSDYLKIDPMLGTNAAFKRLCTGAEKLGVRIILDGVFSHTGDDSVYFDRGGRYGAGACSGEDSPYYGWYDFRAFPDEYRCWWGFKSLPEVNEADPGWQDFIISGDDSVIRTWLRNGGSGYRLDVADELPDPIIEKMRETVKAEKSDALLIGEVWEDATTKSSYGKKRRYALGTALDSVMNYPLKNAIVDFALGNMDAYGLADFLVNQKMNYPKPMYNCLMNLLGSHDTARISTVLAMGAGLGGSSREEQAGIVISAEQAGLGKRLLKLCATLQFSLPGMPCIYYGDEEGMQGGTDPFCRAAYSQGDGELRGHYRDLATLRASSPALKTGDAAFYAHSEDVLCVLRFDEKNAYIAAVNRSDKAVKFTPRAKNFTAAPQSALAALPKLPVLSIPARAGVILPVGENTNNKGGKHDGV